MCGIASAKSGDSLSAPIMRALVVRHLDSDPRVPRFFIHLVLPQCFLCYVISGYLHSSHSSSYISFSILPSSPSIRIGRFPEITYILHAIHYYAAQFTNEVLFVRKVLQFTKELVNGAHWWVVLQLQESWPMGTPHLAMALNW